MRNIGPEQMAMIFDALDADKNGKLEGDEIPDRLKLFKGRLDTNGDGGLDHSALLRGVERLSGKGVA